MTMQENSNLVQLFRELNIEECLGDFILGIEGTISPREAAEKIKEKIKITDNKDTNA